MTPGPKGSNGIPKLPLILGGFAALILLVTLLVRLVGGSSDESPPPGPARPRPAPPRSAPIEAPVADTHQTPEAVPAMPAPAPAAAPPALPPAPRSPPQEFFVDECAERLVRVARPHYEHQEGTPVGRSDLARAGRACKCIERVYQGLGITDLRGEDARSSYDEVLRRHGRELRPAIYSVFTECERHAR